MLPAGTVQHRLGPKRHQPPETRMVTRPDHLPMMAESCPANAQSAHPDAPMTTVTQETVHHARAQRSRAFPGILTPVLLALLAACGGGGGGGDSASGQAPDSQQVAAAQAAHPDGTSSTPPAGTAADAEAGTFDEDPDIWDEPDIEEASAPSAVQILSSLGSLVPPPLLNQAATSSANVAAASQPSSASSSGTASPTTPEPTAHDAGAAAAPAGSTPGALLSVAECELEYREKMPVTTAGVDSQSANQWYIANDGWQDNTRAGIDLNVKPVWHDMHLRGQGIRVAVIDDAVELTHDDLLPNMVPGASLNYMPAANGSAWPLPCRVQQRHGTQVAGIIAARDGNGTGISGVASRAGLIGLNALSFSREGATLKALTHMSADTHIYNNSWGAPDNGHFYAPNPSEETFRTLIRRQVDTGRQGRGSIFVFAGGNGANRGDYAVYDGYMSTLGTLSICAVNAAGQRATYSEPGPSLLVCAPSGETRITPRLPKISTTTIGNNYNNTFNGTSAAAPMASGVIALMLQARHDLSWRDVRLILAKSARKIDEQSPGWRSNAGLNFHHDYGFGLIDAHAAVKMAQTWRSIGGSESLRSCGPYIISPPVDARTIPEVAPLSDEAFAAPFGHIELNLPVPGSLASKINIPANCDIRNIEHVDVRVRATQLSKAGFNGYGDLQISLTSPSGQTSTLATPHKCWATQSSGRAETACTGLENFRFGITRHLEEPAISTLSNEWTLHLADRRPGARTALDSWELTIYGR
ncbi:MAG: S8 family serine peptidase [Lautropia sp.]|nr:S8 family serine peptidase [Lautropia sp.]